MASPSGLRAELGTRIAQRDILAAFLRAYPMVKLWPEDLIPVIGPNYRSRVCECVNELGMNIPNVPRYREWIDKRGKPRRQRLIGGYIYLPYEPLGRDASVPDLKSWPVDGAPYSEEWRLTHEV